jgi:hypothetical protein
VLQSTRWCNEVNSINLCFFQLKRICRKAEFLKGGRGRKPKREIENYAFTLVLKEFDKRTLRSAEEHLTRFVFNERVDHSVLSYWENNPKMIKLLQIFVAVAGAMLDKALSSLFSFVDATKFSSWKIEETFVTVCNKIAKETVYPIGISFEKNTVASPVSEYVSNGNGLLYADAGYDDNKTIGVLFNKGYTPIVCPNKNRWKGYYRHKARKLYRMRVHRLGYRQRGRGESLFGSLTNCYRDRFYTINPQAMMTISASRILCYQIKLLIRINSKLMLFIRHAHSSTIFIYLLHQLN